MDINLTLTLNGVADQQLHLQSLVGCINLYEVANIDHLHADSGSHDQNISNTQVNTAVTHPADDLTSRLVPIFKGNADEVRRFVDTACHAEPTEITTLVNALVKESIILYDLRKTRLWTILHDSGIYPKSLTNWNNQIR